MHRLHNDPIYLLTNDLPCVHASLNEYSPNMKACGEVNYGFFIFFDPCIKVEVIATYISMAEKKNVYEIDRDEFKELKTEVERVCVETDHPLLGGIMDLVLDFLAPYVCQFEPYVFDNRNISYLGRALTAATNDIRSSFFMLSSVNIELIMRFLRPEILMTEPIPCAITTIGHIYNWDYSQQELYDNARVGGNIRSIGNQSGFLVAEGAVDPRMRPKKNKQGRPCKHKSNVLFGTSQTTFRVTTPLREPGKVFAVKVFQKNVSFETLGGLFVDCRDTKDVNNTVLEEMKRALGRPDLFISDFHASMRNYRFRLLGDYNIRVFKVLAIFRQMRRTTHPHIYCDVDINRYPSAIIEIDVARHTSKKRKITCKIFQSGKINLDSNVYYEHVYTWYRFINEFFIKYKDEVLYIPPTEDEYDSDYYYEAEGVDPPPQELLNC